MSLPPKAFYALPEIAARWGCSITDIAGWASLGELRIVTGTTPIQAGAEIIAGLVEIAAADMLTMFRRCGMGKFNSHARRVRPLEGSDVATWRYVTNPEDGLPIHMDDLIILAADVHRFETDHEVFGPVRTVVSGPGVRPRHDWEAFWQHLLVRIYRDGVPDTQEELTTEMREFFARRSEDGDAPDESTVRKRIKTVWHELKAQS